MLPFGAALVRILAGLIFVVFGLGKFISHASETSSFATYGLPHPSAFAYAIGVVELLFGALLLVGLRARVAAVVLAGDMVGAISTAGRIEGGVINLGLAPALLLAMLFLLWAGPGRWALERR